MFNIEIKRLIKQKWIWIMIVVCLAVCTGISFYMKLNLPENFNGKIYSYYMTGLEGDFSYEKYARVQTEYDNMIELINNESEYKQQYFNGELSEGEYKEIKQKVDSAKYRIVTMEYILGKSNYLKKQYDNGIRAAFFDDLTAMDYMLNYRIMYALLVASLFIACFIMWEDRQCNVHMLISSSYLGRKKLGIVRIGVYFMLTVLLCIIVLSVEYFVKIRCMNLNGLSYAAGSITGVKYCELWSIRRYLVLRAVKITGISTIGGGVLLLIKYSLREIWRKELMKSKILLAAIMVVVALVGTVNVNAGVTWGYSNINSSRPTAISNYTKDNNEDGSYVYYQSDVGTSLYIITRIFKNMSDGNKTAYTPTVNANKGIRYWMGSYVSLPSLVKGDKIDLVIGTQTASSDITYYTWNYN